MAQQSIGLGSTANDGNGDDLRTAGDKINDNFTELYGAGYITDYTVTEGDVTAHEAALTITESQISDLGAYQVEPSEGAFVDGDKTKLDGIANAATANSGALADLDTVDTAQIDDDAVTIAKLAATGTASGTTFLRGDNTWATPAGGGGGISNVVDDATPQLGGDLDANGNDIDMGTNVITDTTVGQWITAYGWGDHASAGYQAEPSEGAFADGDKTKLDGIATGATANTGALADLDTVDTAQIDNDAVTRTKIADAALSGADATLITGTAGTDGNTAVWNADGDIVDGPNIVDEGTVSAKATPVAADRLPIFDSEASEAFKTITYSQIATNATNVEAAIEAVTLTGVTPASGDEFLIIDATDGGLKAVDYDDLPGAGGGVDTSGTPVANDFARFTDADTIEGRSYAEVRADLSLEVGTDVQAYDADILKADTSDDLTVGYTQTSNNIGTVSSGTTTLVFSNSNVQRLVNNGAFTLAPPSSGEGVITLRIENDSSAGAVTVTGWDSVTGDALDTTDNNVFLCSCAVVNGESWLIVNAAEGNT